MSKKSSMNPGFSNLKSNCQVNYSLGNLIGFGSYAKVYESTLAYNQNYGYDIDSINGHELKSNEPNCSIKVISKNELKGCEFLIEEEIRILSMISLKHPNILSLYDYFHTEDSICLVTDLATGGELYDHIVNKEEERFTEEATIDIIRTLTEAVSSLHDQNIVHRDLKAENILFKNKESENGSNILLIDFGFATKIEDGKNLQLKCGTELYMAPEMLNGKEYSKPVDIWGIGIITYFMLGGYTPFQRETQREENLAIMEGEYDFEPADYWGSVSPQAKDFISRCLEVDPNKRISIHEALLHPFLRTNTSVLFDEDDIDSIKDFNRINTNTSTSTGHTSTYTEEHPDLTTHEFQFQGTTNKASLDNFTLDLKYFLLPITVEDCDFTSTERFDINSASSDDDTIDTNNNNFSPQTSPKITIDNHHMHHLDYWREISTDHIDIDEIPPSLDERLLNHL